VDEFALDQATIEAARLGERAARGKLIRELGDQWYRVGVRLLGDVELAREATQETAVRFLKQLAKFEGRSGIRTWALGIAINVAREMARERKNAAIDVEPQDGVVGPQKELEDRERAELVNRMLDKLPMRQREAVLLRYFEDLSVAEAASVMGCAGGTVKALTFQALRSMREKMKTKEMRI
jgi:RNA polymerase sigma-70 factor (ECF subfamily)